MRRWLALALFAFCAGVLAQPRAGQPDEVLSAVVSIASQAHPQARSAQTLGVHRKGSGVLIREDTVLTIGYLVIEAQAIEVTGADGRTVPATVGAYDHATGFGLLKLMAPLGGKPLPLGDSGALGVRAPALVASSQADQPTLVYVVSRRAFSGSWEYQLDSAIYTYPPVEDWSGAPLIGPRGELLGIGSLIVPDAGGPGTQSPGNLFVPIDLLKPVLENLLAGRPAGPSRPWLGLNTDEVRGRLFVGRLSPEGPAERAGLRTNDIVLAVAGEEVGSLADFYRKVWALGAAGVDVPVKVLRGAQVRDLTIQSIDRVEYFRARPTL